MNDWVVERTRSSWIGYVIGGIGFILQPGTDGDLFTGVLSESVELSLDQARSQVVLGAL